MERCVGLPLQIPVHTLAGSSGKRAPRRQQVIGKRQWALLQQFNSKFDTMPLMCTGQASHASKIWDQSLMILHTQHKAPVFNAQGPPQKLIRFPLLQRTLLFIRHLHSLIVANVYSFPLQGHLIPRSLSQYNGLAHTGRKRIT
eukprot:1156440-Pelagomonas_calceolata.AAC.11